MKFSKQFPADNQQYIHSSLLHLGIIRWNKSSQRLDLALQYVVMHEVIPIQPVKCLYADLAHDQKCSWSVIERSLRYAVHVLWEGNPEKCSKLFYRTRECRPCPSVSEFLCLYVAAFQRGVIQDWVDSFDEQSLFPV